MTKIEELKKLSPQKRAQCLERLFRKNQRFFAQNHPAVADLLRPGGASPYHINVTDEFLKITNTKTGELCHPEVGLDRFSEKLGDWTHSAWIDLIEGRPQGYTDVGKYSQMVVSFQQSLLGKFPGLARRMHEKIINLPTLSNNKRFSNPVIFMGVFHGLHVDYYLNRTQISRALFIEPDPAKFVLSCYFLDYDQITKRFGDLLLHIGDSLPDATIELFFQKAKISGSVWLRILPGYSFEMDSIIQKIRLKWRQPYDVWHPADWQLTGLSNAMENIDRGALIYGNPIKLSKGSRIAVVGAGPSLSNDLEYLKENQDQFVIFAVHSAVSALRKFGIKPDFQFTLDINPWPEEHFNRLNLDPSVPLVNTVCDIPKKFESFKNVFMLTENGGINPVQFVHTVPFITPTSGNMALAFACKCSPEQVYLFGLDFGFKEAARTHVAEGSVYQTEEDHRSMLASGHLPVESNFNGSEIVTQAYFNLARLCAQNPIKNVASAVKVFNCSDGAKIEGTVSCRSVDIANRKYDKIKDTELIRTMFVSPQKDVHWCSFKNDGKEQLEKMKETVISEMNMKNFNWLIFCQRMDHLRTVLNKIMIDEDAVTLRDRRVEPYVQVVDLLLNCWYRALCFTNNKKEWQQVYEEGYETLLSKLEQMTWPESL